MRKTKGFATLCYVLIMRWLSILAYQRKQKSRVIVMLSCCKRTAFSSQKLLFYNMKEPRLASKSIALRCKCMKKSGLEQLKKVEKVPKQLISMLFEVKIKSVFHEREFTKRNCPYHTTSLCFMSTGNSANNIKRLNSCLPRSSDPFPYDL